MGKACKPIHSLTNRLNDQLTNRPIDLQGYTEKLIFYLYKHQNGTKVSGKKGIELGV